MLKDNMEKELLYELLIEDDATDEIFAVSFVESPAIERDFVYMSKEVKFASIDDEKMLVAGPLLIPEKKIFRIDGEGNPYYVFFSKDTVAKLARKFLRKKYNGEVTAEHDAKVKNIHLVESWIIEQSTKDKSNAFGYTLPAGTWFGIYDVSGNPEVWQKVKDGTFKGFSVEAYVEHRKSDLKLSLDKEINELSDNEAEILLGQIKAIIKKDKRYGKGQRIEMESYADYGDSVRNNAKRGRELNEKNGNKCATQVGKVRSAQLEKGEAISVETLKRMYSYLSRAEAYYDESDMNACGTISFLLWGGKSGLSYSRNKLRELGLIELKEGVPHYTADGKLYEGPTHKDASGRLMTGETHTEDSEYLYHKEELEAQPSITSTYPGQVAKKKKDDK